MDYLQRHPDGLAFHTSSSLSDAAGVSQAATVRFARRLGYEGFSEMRDLAREELRDGLHTLAGRFEQSPQSSEKFDQDAENLRITQGYVAEALPRAAKCIHRAGKAYVLGDRESHGLASFLHRRLHTIASHTRFLEPSFPDEVANLTEKDVLIACVFRRYSSLSVNILEAARRTSAGVVLITDGEDESFVSTSDLLLVCSTKSRRFHWSMVAPVAVIESLVSEVAAVDPKAARQRLEQTERFKDSSGVFI